MKTQLSIEVKSRCIHLFDGTKIPITRKQEEGINSAFSRAQAVVKVEGNLVNLKSISKIVDHWEDSPNKQSNYRDASYFKSPCVTTSETAMQSIANGLRIYIESDNYQGTKKPVDMLRKAEEKLQEIRERVN